MQRYAKCPAKEIAHRVAGVASISKPDSVKELYFTIKHDFLIISIIISILYLE